MNVCIKIYAIDYTKKTDDEKGKGRNGVMDCNLNGGKVWGENETPLSFEI